MKNFTMFVPTRTIFGVGALNKLHEQVMPGKKALLVISNGKSIRDNGYLHRVEEELKIAKVEFTVFDKIEANPFKDTIMYGAAFAKENACDFVVALGGGSVMDAAKIIAMMAKNPGDLWEYVYGGTGKGQRATGGNLPIVCITTTAGTGSEVDPWGVINNASTCEKVACGGLATLFPTFSIVDPELTITIPAKLTAYQGFDALFHSIECYISQAANSLSDIYALTAVNNIANYLARACRAGNDIEAREHLAFASNLSGIVMNISTCTSEHAMEHAMSAYYHKLPHGAGLIMISQAYYEHLISKHACDTRFIKLAKAMGKENAAEPEDFVVMLEKLKRDCDVADLMMSSYGIERYKLPEIVDNARKTMRSLFRFDPIAIKREESLAIYEKSYK